MHAGLNADKFATFGCLRKKFYDSFVLQMKKPLNATRLARFRNTRKRMNQGETQCWALFVISKATYTKTAIKTKFVDRFFKNFFITLTDHCTIKSPNFVSIENFLSCLTWAQKWVNIEAMSYIWLISHQIPKQHARIYRAWLPSEIYSLFFSPILQHYHIPERLS